MFTLPYKGYSIHGYFDRAECHVLGVYYKSFRAAQLAITKLIRSNHA